MEHRKTGPIIAKVNAFFLVQSAMGISISGASFYFFTDNEQQYPEGPHFSPVFFVTILGIAGTVFSLIGLYFYNRYMKEMKYMSLIMLPNIAASVLSFTDVIIYTRTNVQWGLPDKVNVR